MEEMDVPDGGVMDVQGSSSVSLSNDKGEPSAWSDSAAADLNKPSWGQNRLKKPNTAIISYKGIEEETLHENNNGETTRYNDGFGCFFIASPPTQRSSKRPYDSSRRRSTDEYYSSTSSIITNTTNRWTTNFAENRHSCDGKNNHYIMPDTKFLKGQPADDKKRINNNDDAKERPFYNTNLLGDNDDDGSTAKVETSTTTKSTQKEDPLKFPQVLHQLLTALELRGETTIAGFRPHGRAFAIYDPTAFAREVMPRWFRQSKFTSFQRQVNLYNFQRITRGADAGSYWHPLFLRGRETLTIAIQRTKTKGTTRPVQDIAPNFWAMPPIDSQGKESSTLLLSLRRSHQYRTFVSNVRAKRDKSIAVAAANSQTVSTEASSIVTSPIITRRRSNPSDVHEMDCRAFSS